MIHAKATMSGALPSGELWEAGFVITNKLGDDVTLAQAVAGVDAFVAGLTGVGPNLPGQYDPSTTYNPGRVQLFDDATGDLGAKSVGSETWAGTLHDYPPLPPQVAVCVTIRPDRSLTKTHGRFYLPPTVGATTDSRGRMRAETWSAFQGALGNACTLLNGAHAGLIIGFCNAARTNVYPAKRLEVGDVFDTQRGRRDQLTEARRLVLTGF